MRLPGREFSNRAKGHMSAVTSTRWSSPSLGEAGNGIEIETIL